MKFTFFQVLKQISPVIRKPYIVTETNITSDGPRTRVCEGSYETEDQALAVAEAKEYYVNKIEALNKE